MHADQATNGESECWYQRALYTLRRARAYLCKVYKASLVYLTTYRCRGAPARSTCLLVRVITGPCSDPDFNHECQNHLFIKILLCKPPKGIAFDTKPISSKCFFFQTLSQHKDIVFAQLHIARRTEEHHHWETFLHLDKKHHPWWDAFNVTIYFFFVHD